jgi:sugar-specific transcriptional regulator TrmB
LSPKGVVKVRFLYFAEHYFGMDVSSLKEIGLTDGEVRVYLALLKIGSTKTGKLALEARVSSSKVYKILARLEQKGLCGHVIKEGVTFYSAQEPERLLEYIDEEKSRLDEKKIAVESILPDLIKRSNPPEGPQSTVYSGFKAVTNCLKNMLDEILPGGSYKVLGARYYSELPAQKRYFYQHHLRRAERKIKVFMLANEDTRAELIVPTKVNSEIRFLPNYLYSDMQVFMYNNKTFIIVWNIEPVGFLIESEEVRKSFQKYFDAFWKIAKK